MQNEGESWWTFEAVELRLVEAFDLWRRSPGEGRWPFASDGPWHLVKREVWGPDVDKDAPMRPLPLSREEVRLRDEASGWIGMIVERDRRLVIMALLQLARGAKQVRWSRIRKKLGLVLSSSAMINRYDRAISSICQRLNRENRKVDSGQGVESDAREILDVNIGAENGI